MFLFACCGCGGGENKLKALAPPPPPTQSIERSISCAGSEASALSRGTENVRRRKLFDLICSQTEPTIQIGAKGAKNREMNISKVEPYLRSLRSAELIGEMWVVLRMPGALPANSINAIKELMKMLESMDVQQTGHLNYEVYSRAIQRSLSQSNLLAASSPRRSGVGEESRRQSDGGFDGSCVGINASAVKNDAKIVIVRMKDVRLHERFDPYVKLSLVCPFVEKDHGKQTKQTAVHGSTKHVTYDPPQFFGFVCDKNISKAKVILTVVDKNVLAADKVLGSCVVHLKKLKHVKSESHEEDSVELPLTDVESGEVLEGASVAIGVRMVPKSKGFGFGMEQVFEYERWALGKDWGNTSDHFLPTDPGQWADESGQFFWTLDEASKQLPNGWKADPWRASSLFGDLGWQYANAFRSGNWNDHKGQLSVVRRRLWYRCIYGHHENDGEI
mmetsp:Transcript_3822/g.5052  ORF Transcript_3822/g.5052 Transcript_3822/m.5052 type:complete len:446 (-) Transcript_3822:46-1383(-)